jgi:gas vesicle protein
MLEIVRAEDSAYAKTYAQNTVTYENFDAMRGNASDLHNILTVLANQSKFDDKITVDLHIAVPVLQIKKYLRDIVAGHKEPGMDRQLFMKLEGYLKISNSQYKNIRRSVGDWKDNSRAEKATVRNEIKNTLMNLSQQNDLFVHFKNLAHKQEI